MGWAIFAAPKRMEQMQAHSNSNAENQVFDGISGSGAVAWDSAKAQPRRSIERRATPRKGSSKKPWFLSELWALWLVPKYLAPKREIA